MGISRDTYSETSPDSVFKSEPLVVLRGSYEVLGIEPRLAVHKARMLKSLLFIISNPKHQFFLRETCA